MSERVTAFARIGSAKPPCGIAASLAAFSFHAPMDYMRGDARNAGLYYLDGMPCMTPSTPALEPFATFTTTLAGEGPSAHHDADVAEDERKVDLLEELVYSRKKVAAWFLAGYGGSLCCPIILFSIDEAIFASYVFGGEAMAGI